MGKIKKLIKRVGGIMALTTAMSLPVMASAEVSANLGRLGVSELNSSTPLLSIIGAFISTVLALLGILLVILILYAGFIWMTSQGDPGKIKKAKDMLYQAIIGLVIVFAAFAITNFVFSALGSVTSGNAYTAS
jgi:hypothetical protein